MIFININIKHKTYQELIAHHHTNLLFCGKAFNVVISAIELGIGLIEVELTFVIAGIGEFEFCCGTIWNDRAVPGPAPGIAILFIALRGDPGPYDLFLDV